MIGRDIYYTAVIFMHMRLRSLAAHSQTDSRVRRPARHPTLQEQLFSGVG